MLQIQNISKVYRTGSLVQQALDHVSLNLRDNEFVAILGQSGSGKTTLLNIIGGLDRYDEGDLIINGVSTKKYNHRDWDSYRNHTVGFVFQSYNLIPHQSVLANVELALTISGSSRRERTQRAREALIKVGLGDHIHKKPSQLSGGQMQRVAIARALVNDPDILLADEPTGALDSETSIQVMDLLKEVARDRLVVMVTHNPELAEQYATRIVQLRDGVILADSDPYTPESGEEAAVHKNMGRASMSFLTALLLSFNNLWTKKTRTILVAFAGSIGIIGIAMILSLSNGVDRYISNVEEETLQGYPLQITDTSFNLSSMYAMTGTEMPGTKTEAEAEPEKPKKDVQELLTVTRLLSRVSNNDLASLRDYLESGESRIYDYVQAIEYDYNLTPQIYAILPDGVRQVNPDRSFSALGFSSGENMTGLLSAMSSTDSFHVMPASRELYESQYEVLAGRWPESYDECVVVLSSTGRVADVTLYAMGLKDPKELDELVSSFAEGVNTTVDRRPGEYSYEELLNARFRLVYGADHFVYDEEYDVWTDRSGDEKFLRELVEKGEELKVVGVVRPGEDASSMILQMGIGYSASLVDHLIDHAVHSPAVLAQQKDPTVNIFTGMPFGSDERGSVDLNKLFSVDEDAIARAFQFDSDTMNVDFGEMDLSSLDFSGMDMSDLVRPEDFSVTFPTLTPEQIVELLRSVKLNVSAESMNELFRSLLEGFLAYSAEDPATDFAKLPESLRSFMETEEARQIIQNDLQAILSSHMEQMITVDDLTTLVNDVVAGYGAYLADSELTEEMSFQFFNDYLQSDAARALIADRLTALQQKAASIVITQEELTGVAEDLLAGYEEYAQANALPDPARFQESFSEYISSEEAQQLIGESVDEAIDTSALEEKISELFSEYSETMARQIAGIMGRVVNRLSGTISQAIRNNLGALMESLSENMMNAFRVDPEALADAFSMSMEPEELRDLMTTLMSRESTTYEANLKKLGYADRNRPTMITIYPVDFNGKTMVKEILDRYNDMQRAAGQEEKIISYTDMVDALMSSVTGIVNAISYVLIAFVAISLVVSSVMIGVITYISVLERKKEIGILRAIGASRGNISQVFNAETFIIGALAGVFGIVITLLLLIPANHIIHTLTDQTGINAALPPLAGVLLILLSIVLTLIGGIIPSMKAAGSDPVAALRSE